MIKIIEESYKIKKVTIQPEENVCSCGCTNQENVNFEKTEQKLKSESKE
ncbi:MAG: hypothetical protein ACW98X_00915 [Promethearchaeota archaeon]